MREIFRATVTKISQFGTDKYRVHVQCPHCFQSHEHHTNDLKRKTHLYRDGCGAYWYQVLEAPTLSPTLFAVAEAPMIDKMGSQ